jgi:ATP-binding cassette subfamily B (MDR/TAP) protein 1
MTAKKEEIEMKQIPEKDKLAPVSFGTLFRYASTADILLMLAGVISALAAGSAFPLTTVVFGILY